MVNGNLEVMKQELQTKWFVNATDHQFGDGFFPIPVGAHEWLRTRYGEKYMEMPPKEIQGIKLDMFVKIDLDNPYIKYKGIYYCNPELKRKKVNNNRWVTYS